MRGHIVTRNFIRNLILLVSLNILIICVAVDDNEVNNKSFVVVDLMLVS